MKIIIWQARIIMNFLDINILLLSLDISLYLEGYWKYGDRCTFAHGEIDMRAKFVPAESLYPTTIQSMPVDNKQIVQMGYEAADYPAFSQPMGVPTNMVYHPVDIPIEQQMPSNDAFGMIDFVNQITEEDEPQFSKVFSQLEISAHSKTNGLIEKAAPTFSFPISGKANGKSKFGFEYESLTESIDDLELVNSSDKGWKTKLDQAKFELVIGNSQEAEKILKEMMDNKEIKYKDFVSFDNSAFRHAFDPISD